MTETLTQPTLTVRLPTAEPPADVSHPTFRLARPLRGLSVGLRTEGQWRSWLIIVREWGKLLTRDLAQPVILKTGERVGGQGERTRSMVAEWADAVDCAVVGLGTCGSCTSWTVSDAALVEARSKPVVAVVTAEFEVHGRNMAAHVGHRDLSLLVLPYPLETRPETELVSIAEQYYPRALSLLGVIP